MLQRLHPLSLFTGSVLALLALVAARHTPVAAESWEYRIKTNVDQEEIEELAEDGWSYGGYLGTSAKGASSDETLWKRPAK